MSRVLVVGGGAAGMFVAVHAARCGHSVSLYEKNEKLGKKLFITGKGRCNLTNACDIEELFAAVISNSKFLYSSFYGFSNQDTISFFEELGLCTKIERGDRVFPESDHSSDVIRVLEEELKRMKVEICLRTGVRDILVEDQSFKGILLNDGRKVCGDACIVATGGHFVISSTGSTGDGLRFAEETGHHLTECLPSLVPVEVEEAWRARSSGAVSS